ncbi:MAG: hypothetical protein ACRD3T_02960, partial [Terriglobia bacterium]
SRAFMRANPRKWLKTIELILSVTNKPIVKWAKPSKNAGASAMKAKKEFFFSNFPQVDSLQPIENRTKSKIKSNMNPRTKPPVSAKHMILIEIHHTSSKSV